MKNIIKSLVWVLVGTFVGRAIAETVDPFNVIIVYGLVIFGGLFALFFKQYLLNSLINSIKKISGQELILKWLFFMFGLCTATLITLIIKPLFDLMSLQKSGLLIFLLQLFCISGSIFIGNCKKKEVNTLLFNKVTPSNQKAVTGTNQFKILDTSAIIDGRIGDLCKTGFLEGILIIPNFVLNELQKVADSADTLRRNRGRRGLDLLNRIQKEKQVLVRIFDRDYDELTEVDTKILRLARELEAKVVTNDYNLNKVAELYGVQVLNINDLSNAIKPIVLPGEEMAVHVLRDGKEHGQGIGYLEDGTMIVIEGGKSYIGLDIEILVTSVLQTSAGRMIFAKPKDYLLSKAMS